MPGPFDVLQVAQSIFNSGRGPFRKTLHGERVEGQLKRTANLLGSEDVAEREKGARLLFRGLRSTEGELASYYGRRAESVDPGAFADEERFEALIPQRPEGYEGRFFGSAFDPPTVAIGLGYRRLASELGVDFPTLGTGKDIRAERQAYYRGGGFDMERTELLERLQDSGEVAPEEVIDLVPESGESGDVVYVRGGGAPTVASLPGGDPGAPVLALGLIAAALYFGGKGGWLSS